MPGASLPVVSGDQAIRAFERLGYELSSDALSIECAGEALSRCEVEYRPGSGDPRQVRSPELFESAHRLPQLRLFGLDETLGEGWLKALKLGGYAPRRAAGPPAIQGTLSHYWLGLPG